MHPAGDFNDPASNILFLQLTTYDIHDIVNELKENFNFPQTN